MKFLKLTIASLVGTGVLLAVLAPTGTLSTATMLVGDSVEQQIPFEFQLERAKTLIADVEPQIDACKRRVAESEVEIENLDQEIAQLEQQSRTRRSKLAAQEDQLTRTCKDGSVADHSPHVVARIKHQLRAAKRNDQQLTSKRTLREHLTKRLAAERKQLDTVSERKVGLEHVVQRLHTQKRHVEALAARHGSVEFDETALSEAQDLLATLGKQLDVQQKVLENEAVFEFASEDPAADSEDVLDELNDFLSRSAPQGR